MEAFLKKFQHLKVQLEEVKSATDNFDNNNIIGRGGFGKVYKGVLSNSKWKTVVAIKRLNRDHGQGDPEFWREILMLSRYTHENLVSLVGFCDECDEKVLVYEHASHGSLDSHLSNPTLTWRQRLKICISAAKGLRYLHNPRGTQQRVLHRDIKSSNILLDENWNAKVSDMGLSKIGLANQQHTFLVTIVVGTLGYIDPMYMQTSILTKESDVYSFGVVLFEVLCGRLCYEKSNGHIQTLAQKWKKSYKGKKLDDTIFQDLKQHMDQSSLETFSEIAYQCLRKSRHKRPRMSHVVEKLEIALRFQEICEEKRISPKEMRKIRVPPLPVNKSKYNMVLLFDENFIIDGKMFFREICMWRNPVSKVVVHVLFIILLIWFPYVIVATMYYNISTFLISRIIFPPRHPSHQNTKISFSDRLRSVAGGIQMLVGNDISIYWKWMQSLLFSVVILALAVIIMVIPVKVVTAVTGLYVMRHPSFRNRLPFVHEKFS